MTSADQPLRINRFSEGISPSRPLAREMLDRNGENVGFESWVAVFNLEVTV